MQDASYCSQKEQKKRKKKAFSPVVSHRALHAERAKHKKTKMQLVKIISQFDKLKLAYFTLLEESKHFCVPEQKPDPQEDIVAYMRWLAAQTQQP